MKKEQVIIAVIITMGIIIIWWVISTFGSTKRSSGPLPIMYIDMRTDINSHPDKLWMSENIDRFSHYLRESQYRYRIYESDGNMIYDNKPNPSSIDITKTLEYKACTVSKEFYLTRNNKRYLAIRVTDNKGKYRIIHMTSNVLSVSAQK